MDCIVVAGPPKVEVRVPRPKGTKEERRKLRIIGMGWEMAELMRVGPRPGARSLEDMEKEMDELLKAQPKD